MTIFEGRECTDPRAHLNFMSKCNPRALSGILIGRAGESVPNPTLTAFRLQLDRKVGHWTFGLGYRHQAVRHSTGGPDISQLAIAVATFGEEFGRSAISSSMMRPSIRAQPASGRETGRKAAWASIWAGESSVVCLERDPMKSASDQSCASELGSAPIATGATHAMATSNPSFAVTARLAE